MGRPRKNIDKKQFEDLCAIQCTEKEICGWFDVCEDTLNAWCKREYGLCFSDTFEQKRGKGKISLRRRQFQCAEKGNASMLIWLGKQYLGQKDSPTMAEIAIDNTAEDALSKALRELAEEM